MGVFAPARFFFWSALSLALVHICALPVSLARVIDRGSGGEGVGGGGSLRCHWCLSRAVAEVFRQRELLTPRTPEIQKKYR